jgi:hypothetical protein
MIKIHEILDPDVFVDDFVGLVPIILIGVGIQACFPQGMKDIKQAFPVVGLIHLAIEKDVHGH